MGQVYGWTVEEVEKHTFEELNYLLGKIKRDREEEKREMERLNRGR